MLPEKIYKISVKQDNFSCLFLFLFFISIPLFFLSIIVGVVFMVSSIGILLSTSDIIVDKENSRIKKQFTFLGIRFGKWLYFSKIEYVSILRILQKQTVQTLRTCSQKTYQNNAYQINLIINDKRPTPIKLFSTANREEAIEKGLELGEYLGIKVYDVTTHDKKWIL